MAGDIFAQSIALAALNSGGGTGAVSSVNGMTGTVLLTATDVSALPDSTVIPTKTSDLTNDSGFLTSHQSLADYSTTVQMNTAIDNHHDSTKQDKLTAGDNITITNNVISASGGGSEPSAYLKSAVVSGNTLTLTNKDNTTTVFTPTTDLSNYSTTAEMNTAISNYHDSTKQNKLVTDDTVVYPLYVDTGELRLGYGNGLHKVDNLLEVEVKSNGGITLDANGISADTSVVQPKLTAGTGISISNNQISATNNGTVTSVIAGTGLTGGTITGSGTVAVDTSTIATKSFVTGIFSLSGTELTITTV